MHTEAGEVLARPGVDACDWSAKFPYLAYARLASLEYEVAERLRFGDTNAEIGRYIGISEKTVKARLTKLMRKLGAENRTQAALIVAGVMKKSHE